MYEVLAKPVTVKKITVVSLLILNGGTIVTITITTLVITTFCVKELRKTPITLMTVSIIITHKTVFKITLRIIAIFVSYPMLRMTHPSRNFFVLSLFCVYACLYGQEGRALRVQLIKCSRRRSLLMQKQRKDLQSSKRKLFSEGANLVFGSIFK
jgi:hypothetical protein